MNTKEMESEVHPGVYFQSERLVEALKAVSEKAVKILPDNHITVDFLVEGDVMGIVTKTTSDIAKLLFMDIDMELQGVSMSEVKHCSFKLLSIMRETAEGEGRVAVTPIHEYSKIKDGDLILVRMSDTAPVVTNLKD